MDTNQQQDKPRRHVFRAFFYSIFLCIGLVVLCFIIYSRATIYAQGGYGGFVFPLVISFSYIAFALSQVIKNLRIKTGSQSNPIKIVEDSNQRIVLGQPSRWSIVLYFIPFIIPGLFFVYILRSDPNATFVVMILSAFIVLCIVSSLWVASKHVTVVFDLSDEFIYFTTVSIFRTKHKKIPRNQITRVGIWSGALSTLSLVLVDGTYIQIGSVGVQTDYAIFLQEKIATLMNLPVEKCYLTPGLDSLKQNQILK